MEHRSREVEDKVFTEQVEIGINLEVFDESFLEKLITEFEDVIRRSIKEHVYSPLLNSFVIETSVEKRDSLVIKAYVELYLRKDLPRKEAEKIIDEAIEKGFRHVEDLIRRINKRDQNNI
jgi:hypothetical protein